MMSPTVSRRSLLAIASVGPMMCVGEGLSFASGYSQLESLDVDSDLIALCSELGCPKQIGKACLLALPPSERDVASLSTAICGQIRLLRGHASPDTLAQSISQRSRADFQAARILYVNGWILALTEARVYALAALVSEM
jgi:hypothetical protein